MKDRTFAGALAVLALAGLAAAAHAQVVDIGPLPQPATVLVRERPVVTVLLRGDHGEVRVTGAMEQAPEGTLRLTDASGRSREAVWTEIRSLGQVAYAAEGLPVGSYQAALVSDPAATGQGLGGAGYASRVLELGQPAWRMLRLPEGSMTLRGEPYGTFTFPLARLVAFQMEPVRGNVPDLPAGNVRIEVFEGQTVTVPLPEVRLLQRDVSRGTVAVTLRDEQTFTGRLVELPQVALAVETERGKIEIPLDQVVQFERVLPGGRRL
jgi:hypothetical protein